VTAEQHRASTSAKILYRPVGLAASLLAGALAGMVTRKVWQRVSPRDEADPPTALQSEYDIKEVLLAALVSGAIFAVTKAAVDRAGARLFERWTGEWPGD
jgi:hypothetical protein